MMDRHIGKSLARPANLNHKTFGIQFAGYVEWCHQQRAAPRGRALLVMCALRFRLDRNRGRTMNILQLYSIQLESFKLPDVRNFIDRVRYVIAHLQHDDLKDRQLLFNWLFEKFKGWNAIATEV